MKILADLHTHTIGSGHAYSTLSENAQIAAQKGLEIIGMTDHGPSMPGASHLYYFCNFSIIPKRIYGVRILRGVEANIISQEGELDLPQRYLGMMDLVLAGLHVICYPGGGIEENTHAFLKAMENPFTDIMAHPGRLEFPLDLEKIAFMSYKLDVPLELNNSSLCPEKGSAWDNCRILAKAIAKYGGPVSLGSDAHFWDRVGEFSNCLQLIQESGIKEEQILNTSLSKLEDYLKRRHEMRPLFNSTSN